MRLRRALAIALLPLAGCNMVISETPVFTETDRTALTPRDGIWLSDDPECRFDPDQRRSKWPRCAVWAVVSGPKGELLVFDGKGQSNRAELLIAKGEPLIVQIHWHDDAKDDGKTFYVFFGLEPRGTAADGTFVTASSWEAKCGLKKPSGSDIKPYPGISAECVPSSADAIRSAALASRATAEMAMRWRWLRAGDR